MDNFFWGVLFCCSVLMWPLILLIAWAPCLIGAAVPKMVEFIRQYQLRHLQLPVPFGHGPYRAGQLQPEPPYPPELCFEFGQLCTYFFQTLRASAVEQLKCCWHSKPVQLIWRLSLTSSALLFMFWGSAYLFSNEPAQVTSLGTAFYPVPLVEGLAVSRMWDVVFAPLAVILIIGLLWLHSRIMDDSITGFSIDRKFSAALFGVSGSLMGLVAWPGLLAEIHSPLSLVEFFPFVGMAFLAAFLVIGLMVEVPESAVVFRRAKMNYILSNVNCHKSGFAMFSICTMGGVFGGLLFWGLPIGLAIGVSSGLVIGGFTTCCLYLLAFLVRLVMLVPRFMRWLVLADAH